MAKIGICIDPHITERHRCRCDNFFETVLGKLKYIADNNDYVIVCGDLFHICNNSTYLFYRMYQFFQQYRGKFHVIPGNHDLMNNNMDRLDKTTLGSLVITGAITMHLSEFTIDGVSFQPSLVIKDMDNIPVDVNNGKILIGHNYFEMDVAPKESFTRDDIRKLNYKIVFLGHDHSPHDEEFIGNSILVRMGSLTRIDTQKYNKERNIYYYQLDTNTVEYEKMLVPSKPTQDVYTPEAFASIGRQKVDTTFIQIGEVLKKLKKEETGINSIKERLMKVASEKEVDYIESLHTLNNVRFF